MYLRELSLRGFGVCAQGMLWNSSNDHEGLKAGPWNEPQVVKASLPKGFGLPLHDLDKRYKIFKGGPEGQNDFLRFQLGENNGFATWISHIAFFTKELLAPDLKLVERLMEHLPSSGNLFCYVQRLRDQLRERHQMLICLEQLGIPHALEVLCLLLRNIWARITNSTSKLAEQPVSTLQNLCKMIEHIMKDWKWKVLSQWFRYFHGPLSGLQRRSALPIVGHAVNDLQVIQAEAQEIISSRLAEAADPLVVATAVEQDHQVTSVNVSPKMNEELPQVKTDSLPQKEEKCKVLQHDTLKCKEVFDQQKKFKEELLALKAEVAELKSENQNMKCKLKMLESEMPTKQTALPESRLRDEQIPAKPDCQKFELDIDMFSKESNEMQPDCNLKMKKLESDNMTHPGTVLDYVTQALNQLSMECQRLKHNDPEKADTSDCYSEISWVQVHPDTDTSMLNSASSGFSVDTDGPRCFMVDAVFKTSGGAFLSGTDLYLSLKSPMLDTNSLTSWPVSNPL